MSDCFEFLFDLVRIEGILIDSVKALLEWNQQFAYNQDEFENFIYKHMEIRFNRRSDRL